MQVYMENFTGKLIEIVEECRRELKELQNSIDVLSDDTIVTKGNLKKYKEGLQQQHNCIRNKLYILLTILKTGSMEIVHMVKDRKHL